MSGMKLIASAFAAALVPASVNGAAAASDPVGIWLNDTGRGAVEIKMCGNALCGHVVWVKDASDTKGCGKQILSNVTSVGGGRWDNGWIYSPERGRRYNVEVTPLANGTLRVTGYAGMRFMSKTMIWKRAPDNLERCGTTEAKAVPAPAPQAPPETKSSVASVAEPSTPNIAIAAKSNDIGPPSPLPATAPDSDRPATTKADLPNAHEPPVSPKNDTPAAEPEPNQEDGLS